MVKYNLTKVESAIGAAVVIGDYLVLAGDPIKTAIGYAVIAGIAGYFGKHFVSNALATEKEVLANTPK